MTPADIAAVTGLLNKVEIADSRRPLNDHLWIDLRHGGRAGFAGLIAWDPDSVNPVAYCQVSRGNDSWALDLVIDPHHREQTLELGKGLGRGPVQHHANHHQHARAHGLGVEQRHHPINEPQALEPLHPAQAGGGAQVHLLGQGHVGQRRIAL